jgi:NADH-quinone oxidoreductase subunit N
MFINKNESPVERFRIDLPTRLGLAICVGGIVVTGFASVIFEMIRGLSYGV